jgi:hypothetical protein
MAKIVYNSCYGGFGLSAAAMVRYAEIKGFKIYPTRHETYSSLMVYWLVPPEERPTPLNGDWQKYTNEEWKIYNEEFKNKTINDDKIERDDPALVQVVEELGEAANGDYARLEIEEVPAGTLYRIDEYDGKESVETRESYDWKIAR